jgi:hypothetical protein
MHCSGCGTELEAGLNYCKRCGKRVREEKSAVGQGLTNALGAIGVFGVLGFVAALYVMLRSPIIAPGTIMVVSFFYLATLFGVLFLILKQTELFTHKGQSNDDVQPESAAYLNTPATAQLGESTLEPISVTEHTTKDLAEAPVIKS